MAKTAEVKTRVAPELKEAAREVFAYWGFSLSDALNAFLVKSVEVGGFPFDMRTSKYDWDALGALRRQPADKHLVLPTEADETEDLYDDLV